MYLPVFMSPHQPNGQAGLNGVSVRPHAVVVSLFDLVHVKDMASVPVWSVIVASKSLNNGAILISVNHGPSGASTGHARLPVEWVNIRELDLASLTARTE